MVRVNDESHSFLATHAFIHKWNEPSCLYTPATEHHRTLAGTHFPYHWGQEITLAWVAGYILRWYACPKMVTHPSTNRNPRRVTLLVRPMPLLLCQTATWPQNCLLLWSHPRTGGAVVQPVERWTCDKQVVGANPARGKSCVTTLGKLFIPMCLCHQAV